MQMLKVLSLRNLELILAMKIKRDMIIGKEWRYLVNNGLK